MIATTLQVGYMQSRSRSRSKSRSRSGSVSGSWSESWSRCRSWSYPNGNRASKCSSGGWKLSVFSALNNLERAGI